MTRRQCAKCPWKRSTNPHEIPDGYSLEKHRSLRNTIADGPSLDGIGKPIQVMACHESEPGHEIACVGWLVNQLGPGNNLPLRIAVVTGALSADVELVGPQHERFEDTLPGPKTGA